MNNFWNRIVYRFWSPVYDWLIELPWFVKGRTRAWQLANLSSGEEVLLVGVGTGIDFKYLPEDVSVTGIDLSSSMLQIAKKKAGRLNRPIELLRSDAEKIPWEDNRFHVVALHLILSVVSNPEKCFQEAVRVIRPGGRIIVFDKFLSQTDSLTWKRKLINHLTRPFGTDINRRFEEIIRGTNVKILSDEPLVPGSAFRVILISCPM